MAHPITIPKLGLTMTDCTLVQWARQDGEKINPGDILYTVETEKIANDIEADAGGYLQRAADIDTIHNVGAVIGYLHPTNDKTAGGVIPEVVAKPEPRVETTSEAQLASTTDAVIPSSTSVGEGARIRISPVARRIAEQNGLAVPDLAGTGTGPSGAILKRDVERRLHERPRETAPAIRQTVETTAIASRRPLTGMRRTIANRMLRSLRGSAQMTGFGRVDMSETVQLRTALVAREQELGVRVTYTDIVVKAAATVLAEMPNINASIIDDEIVQWADANIGIAIAIENGLVVPVIHQANAKTLTEIARKRDQLVRQARSGGLSSADLQGGTFSVSNFGSYGGDFETPILNPPQSALLGIGQIADEPVVRDGQIVIRPMMMLSMTFDHRLIDGAEAGRFRARLKSYLESPALQMASLR